MAQMKFNLSSLVRASDTVTNPNNPIGVDVTASGTLSARSYINASDYHDIYMIYDFDLTALPTNIAITSFEIQMIVQLGSSYNQGSISVTTGTDETLLATKTVGTVKQRVYVNDISPTVQQIKDNLRLRVQSRSSGRGYNHEIDLYGATAIINYEVLPPQINLGTITPKNYSVGRQKVRQIYKGEDLYYGLSGNLRELEYIEITPTFTDAYLSPDFSVPIDLRNVQTATWEIELDATDGVVGWYYNSVFDFYMDFRLYGQAIFKYGQKSFSIPNWTKGRHRYTIDFANSRLGYDNTWYNMETVTYSGISGANFGATVCLNATNTVGYDAGLIGKFYRMKLSTSTQSYELVPCMYKPSSYKYAALYDLVNKTIYYIATDSTVTRKRNSLRLGPIADLYDEGYEQLRFIEGTGTQYIDTGVKANSNVDMEAEIAITNHGWHVDGTPDVGGFMGNVICGDSGGNRRSLRLYTENNIYFYNANTGWPSVYPKLSTVMERNKYQIKGNEFFMNDVLQISTTSGTWTDATNNMELLNGGEYPVKGRLYSSKVWVDNHLERDFVPAKRLSDGELGMYDLVYHQFYTNAGTGEFLEPIPEMDIRLPKEYQEVEYIESTGEQWIDIGVKPTISQEYSIKFSMSDISGNYVVFGSRGSGSWDTSQNQIYFNLNKETIIRLLNRANVNNYIIEGVTVNKIIEEEDFQCPNVSLSSGTRNFYLFCLNNVGSPAVPSKNKLYYFKIKDNDILVRDLVPCYRKSDNVVGMYDLVGNKFYTNDGTGTFIKGNDVDVPEGYQELNYIRSFGTGTGTGQYVDTGYAPKAGDKVKISIIFNPQQITSSEREMLAKYGDGENFQVGWKTGTWFGSDKYHFDGGSSPTAKVQAVSGEYQVTNNSSLNLFLFAQNEGGTPHWDCSMFLYRCSIWVNDTPIREFIPCYRKSDGLNGLYDVIERKYYPCQGVNYFTGGQEVL